MNEFDVRKAYKFDASDGSVMYATIMTVDDGWDYNILSEDYSVIDGGQIDNPGMTDTEVLNDMLDLAGITIDYESVEEIDYDDFISKLEDMEVL